MPGKQYCLPGVVMFKSGMQERSLHMFNDIFVGVMIVVALGAGIWCWWFENIDPKEQKKSDKNRGKKE